MEPPPAVGAKTRGFFAREISACWIVAERRGYSIHVTPHATPVAARLAYKRTNNPSAKASREAVIGRVVVSAYRLPSSEWIRLVGIVRNVRQH